MDPPKSLSSLGFLTVVADELHGYFGGYLILNRFGRPLEFHCTAPVRPNRAQEILYGATLMPFLCGEQIARALIEKAKLSPPIVLTDAPDVLAVRQFTEQSVVLLNDAADAALEELKPIAAQLDLAEPFERIRQAIEEAQKAA